MFAFIYLAYQTMTSLTRIVPIFTDRWIECLGTAEEADLHFRIL